MKKIAIITHYYRNKNYGANLQAYALCQRVFQQNHHVEQISFLMLQPKMNRKASFLGKCKKMIHFCLNSILKQKEKRIQDGLSLRNAKIFEFNTNQIPHSTLTYTNENIADCVDQYDAFITGSDQVWNLTWYYPAFFLDFVPSTKSKLSYAASVSMNTLTEEQEEIFRKSLADYQAVSVREESAVDLLKDLSPVPVEWVLDSTFLLSREEWDTIAPPRRIKENYLFCYYLGEDQRERQVATAFAKERGLKLVTLPHLLGHYRKCDAHFGDELLYDVGPDDFISLIKYADYVLTDSFHAAVFSNIYEKEHFIFEREGHKGMNGRIESLCKLFETENRFCNTNQRATCAYIENIPSLEKGKIHPLFEAMKEKSMEFLFSNLNKL